VSRPLLLAVVVETHRGLSLAYTYVVPASDVLPAANAVPHEIRVGDRQTLAAYLTQAALHCRETCGRSPIVRVLDYHHPIPPDPSDPLCRVIREGNGEPVPDTPPYAACLLVGLAELSKVALFPTIFPAKVPA